MLAVARVEAHSGPDAMSASSVPSAQVAVVAPTVSVVAIPDQAGRYVCSEATVDGVTYYWDAQGAAWSTDGDAPCDPVVEHGVCRVWDIRCTPLLTETFPVVDGALGPMADPLLCPLLGGFAPGGPAVKVEPDGEVRLSDQWAAWDCA